MRAGAYGLSLLMDPLDVGTMQRLADGPRPLRDLRRALGTPPETTLRDRLKALSGLGVLARRRRSGFPGSVDCELTTAGRDLLGVASVAQAWLAVAPDGPRALGTAAAKRSLKALTEAWSTSIVRAVAARPLSLTELSRLISELNYPSLERRLVALRVAGLVEACPGSRRGTPYASSDWLRRAAAPLVAAARWERRHAPRRAAPLSRLEVEATFLLAAPQLHMATNLVGTCRLAVEIGNGGGEHGMAGVLVGVEGGRVSRCVSRLRGEAGAWVSGSITAWLDAPFELEPGRLETGGDVRLATALLDGLHGALSGAAVRPPLPGPARPSGAPRGRSVPGLSPALARRRRSAADRASR